MNLNDLDEIHKENIIGSTINLIQALSEGFGPEVGMDLYDNISNHLGTGTKEAVFMTMLSGRSAGTIMIRGIPEQKRLSISRIDVIKCIRNYTGFGLKEAKDVMDELFYGADKILKIDWQKRNDFARDIRKIGVECIRN